MDIDMHSILHDAWREVGSDYRNGLIVSESTLMASLYFHLRIRLRSVGGEFSLFTEPSLYYTMEGERACRLEPDIVVIRRRSSAESPYLAAIIELKFSPFWRPAFDEDISKFDLLSRASKSYCHAIDVATGKDSDACAFFCPETVFVFGVVGNKDHAAKAIDAHEVQDRIPPEIRNRFIHLVGQISRGKITFD